MGMKEEATEIAAEVVEKAVEAGGHLASEAAECACAGTKIAVQAAAHLGGGILAGLIRIFGPKD